MASRSRPPAASLTIRPVTKPRCGACPKAAKAAAGAWSSRAFTAVESGYHGSGKGLSFSAAASAAAAPVQSPPPARAWSRCRRERPDRWESGRRALSPSGRRPPGRRRRRQRQRQGRGQGEKAPRARPGPAGISPRRDAAALRARRAARRVDREQRQHRARLGRGRIFRQKPCMQAGPRPGQPCRRCASSGGPPAGRRRPAPPRRPRWRCAASPGSLWPRRACRDRP